jgi:rubredoxin
MPHPPPLPPSLSEVSRHGKWRKQKAAKEDIERQERGEQPKKRYTKVKDQYQCTKCQQPKKKETGHTQYRGKWYCPSSNESLDDWRKNVRK